MEPKMNSLISSKFDDKFLEEPNNQGKQQKLQIYYSIYILFGQKLLWTLWAKIQHYDYPNSRSISRFLSNLLQLDSL